MKIIHKIKYYFTEEDYQFIRKQVKEKHIKMRLLAKECGLSRSAFYDILKGKYPVGRYYLIVLKAHEIVIPFTNFYVEE